MKIAARIALVLGVLVLASPDQALPQQGQTDAGAEVEVISFEAVTYPPLGWQARIEGVVVVRVTLDADGKVTDAVALSGHGIFVPFSLENVRKWRFRPDAQRTAVIVYNFKLLAGRCEPMSQTNLVGNFVTVASCLGPLQVSGSH
jgi:TonB family protein